MNFWQSSIKNKKIRKNKSKPYIRNIKFIKISTDKRIKGH